MGILQSFLLSPSVSIDILRYTSRFELHPTVLVLYARIDWVEIVFRDKSVQKTLGDRKRSAGPELTQGRARGGTSNAQSHAAADRDTVTEPDGATNPLADEETNSSADGYERTDDSAVSAAYRQSYWIFQLKTFGSECCAHH